MKWKSELFVHQDGRMHLSSVSNDVPTPTSCVSQLRHLSVVLHSCRRCCHCHRGRVWSSRILCSSCTANTKSQIQTDPSQQTPPSAQFCLCLSPCRCAPCLHTIRRVQEKRGACADSLHFSCKRNVLLNLIKRFQYNFIPFYFNRFLVESDQITEPQLFILTSLFDL